MKQGPLDEEAYVRALDNEGRLAMFMHGPGYTHGRARSSSR